MHHDKDGDTLLHVAANRTNDVAIMDALLGAGPYAGDYFVIVTSFEAGETGAHQVSVR